MALMPETEDTQNPDPNRCQWPTNQRPNQGPVEEDEAPESNLHAVNIGQMPRHRKRGGRVRQRDARRTMTANNRQLLLGHTGADAATIAGKILSGSQPLSPAPHAALNSTTAQPRPAINRCRPPLNGGVPRLPSKLQPAWPHRRCLRRPRRGRCRARATQHEAARLCGKNHRLRHKDGSVFWEASTFLYQLGAGPIDCAAKRLRDDRLDERWVG